MDINDDVISHYGVQGMKWGVRRYQNKDGTLTDEGKARRQFGRRVSKADRTRRDVNSIVNSLSSHDKALLDAKHGYLSFEEGRYVVKRILLKDRNKPVAFMDFLSDGWKGGKENLNVAIASRGDSHGKGYGKAVAKIGSDWIEKNRSKYGTVSWNAYTENVASQNLAKSTGWSYNKDSSSETWQSYSR